MDKNNLEKKPTKRKKHKCFVDNCRTKLNLIDLQIECKCNKYYCNKHRQCEFHNCTHINVINTNETVKKQIEDLRCVASKMLRI